MKMDGIISEELIENTYLFCRKRIQDSEAAKDLSHDIILCALTAIRKGKSFTDFYGWYWRMARNKYADYLTARKMLPENIKPLAEEYRKEAGGVFVDTLLPYVRKDLISNFLYWDVRSCMQQLPALFYYGIEEGKALKLPQDYSRSAAGLLLTKNKA